MLTVCPSCKTSLALKQAPPATGVTIRCSTCRSVFRLVPKKPACSPGSGNPPSITVVVANDDPSFCTAVGKILGPGFRLVFCHDGVSALAAIERHKPQVALIDVALPRLYGFQVCESVRSNQDLASVKLVISTSTYDTRRYIRDPGSMYGADALIEKHRIPGALKELLTRLVPDGGGSASTSVPPAALEPAIPSVGDNGSGAGNTAELASTAPAQPIPEEHKKAQRLARLIVSDIALYNKSLVEAGVRNGTFYKVLADDIREGRALYDRRVSADLRSSTSYLDDAFSDLIRRKEQELNMR